MPEEISPRLPRIVCNQYKEETKQRFEFGQLFNNDENLIGIDAVSNLNAYTHVAEEESRRKSDRRGFIWVGMRYSEDNQLNFSPDTYKRVHC